MVRIPSSARRAAVLGPIPHSLFTARGARNSRSEPGGTTVRPSGFSMSEAILAIDLLVATPTEMVNLSSACTRALSSPAICLGDLLGDTESVTSRYASSRDSGSTCGEKSRKIAITWRDTWEYRSNLGGTLTA